MVLSEKCEAEKEVRWALATELRTSKPACEGGPRIGD